MSTDLDIAEHKHKLVNSLLYFTQIFYYLRTSRTFDITYPIARESHIISICKALTRVFDGECRRLIINVPPRYGKSEIAIHFVAWALAQYSQSNFLYVSYSHSLAKKQTQTIRSIMTLREYRELFSVHIRDDASAKDNFETTAGGSVYAAGAGGSITGRGAGINNSRNFGGGIIIDDIHKPDEVHSDTIREGVIDWYYNTLQSRVNSPKTPIIFIGQRLHEDDLCATLIKTGEWETLILPALDAAGNALHQDMHDVQSLKTMQEQSPYHFASQYQQDPQPAGGGIYKEDWFVLFDDDPQIISTFITIDTAETDKTYNDATVFSFWGLYKVKIGDVETDKYGLHWLDCAEIRVEPKDLQGEFFEFYKATNRHAVKPSFVAVEKKSTGVTLASVLKGYQGLRVVDIERTRVSGSKTTRFLEAQPYVSDRLISFNRNAKHTKMCIDHCKKITANDTHRYDDIADTMYDAIKLALIDDVVIKRIAASTDYAKIAGGLYSKYDKIDRLRQSAFNK